MIENQKILKLSNLGKPPEINCENFDDSLKKLRKSCGGKISLSWVIYVSNESDQLIKKRNVVIHDSSSNEIKYLIFL